MRHVRIWRTDTNCTYARDDETGEEFWFPPFHEMVDCGVAQLAVARLLQDQLQDFAAWLDEGTSPAA